MKSKAIFHEGISYLVNKPVMGQIETTSSVYEDKHILKENLSAFLKRNSFTPNFLPSYLRYRAIGYLLALLLPLLMYGTLQFVPGLRFVESSIILAIILTNALKYSQVDKPVVVEVVREVAHVRVAVHDQGPGLTAEQQKHIWERFYRVPGVHVRSGSGVGLGLYICRTLIERMDGQVGLESTPGQGSTFWFTLPLAQHQAELLKTRQERITHE